MDKFDLERFKAGEYGFCDGYEYKYVTTLPDGQIAYMYKYRDRGVWGVWCSTPDGLNGLLMRPKEEWALVQKRGAKHSSTIGGRVYSSLAEANTALYACGLLDDYEPIQITRQ